MSVGNVAATKAKETSSKMHRRSRTGCFTCRLRRKKCDEGKHSCKACRHLGLKCEYKRPMWWSNTEKRAHQKELIKDVIKRTKLNEKAEASATTQGLNDTTPPSLSHSVPTSDGFSDEMARTRGVSLESQFSLGCNYNSMTTQDLFSSSIMPPPQFVPSFPPPPPFGNFAPYEVDIKTERQTFVNDIPTRRDSTMSTFSTYQMPAQPGQELPTEGWIQHDYYESRRESFAEEPVNFDFFDFPHHTFSPTHQTMIQVEECDQHLLNHFIDNVLRLIFPILDANQHGSARSDVILPALESNKAYLHCCLSISALHLKATEGIQGEQIDADIMRHRHATILKLCEALSTNDDYAQILEATLGMIFFHCSVGRPDDGLLDISWQDHFRAATDLINKLELPHVVGSGSAQPPFNMVLASWIDILGATMLGRAPVFADTYREKNLSNAAMGLAELMGCDDRIMFLISEIACLDALKLDGMDEVMLCTHIKMLGDHISATEPGPDDLASPFSVTGAIRPRQLCKNMTAVFRAAARIYLCSLVPHFDRRDPNVMNLVDTLVDAMSFIPPGPEGFDRSLVWPLLIAGSVSLQHSSFRLMFTERSAQMGDASQFGSFGRMAELLKDVWTHNDDAEQQGERQSVHWRDVMIQRGWDFLLI
ncbi:hypothetical protein P152DRAFT_390354 [Eremomyces bilateralis CBS 781.70]|uniref:Zn(2)-C6 fungal-type domain-containing protein n=1 Tax=Eremomyces bilateralis CBS 781.70 TaxID=1392243 RepID=A0A6G1GD86_9PEZI|nr:uncharacterized protein P152DRAFT_390354 [Eremomyces bilateralis CBS 781.70]KAF1815870.1 hypothetical protein P152DRAFT_390354 [Eremomyces bilateralis CBS 781.70]